VLKFMVNSLSWLLGICFSALLFVIVGRMVYIYTLQGLEFGEDLADRITRERYDYDVEFVLDDVTSMEEVAQMLEDLGIIESQWLFRAEMMLMGRNEDYEPGNFVLNQSLSTPQIHARLRAGPVVIAEENRITIPEGFTQESIAVYLENREFFTAEEFIEVANTHDFGFNFLNDIAIRPSRLEGYLFPDTYFISANPTPVEVITNMLSQFNEVFTFEYRQRAADMGMTIDEIVIMASIIEREVRVAEERPMVARVILNRLAAGMPLQIDATVAYARGIHLDRVMYSDLEYDSPFNTYRVTGLPWGPISNPGAASIHAALFPATGDWLYYVLINADTGEHFFTSDYNEFLRMRDLYMPRPWED